MQVTYWAANLKNFEFRETLIQEAFDYTVGQMKVYVSHQQNCMIHDCTVLCKSNAKKKTLFFILVNFP